MLPIQTLAFKARCALGQDILGALFKILIHVKILNASYTQVSVAFKKMHARIYAKEEVKHICYPA